RHRRSRRSSRMMQRCAQRLSASLGSARGSTRAPGTGATSAQRLSASLGSAQRRRGTGREAVGVLNASRRHWGRHGVVSSNLTTSMPCSTPLGVTGVGTPRTRRRRPSRSGAQRLSASLGSAHVERSQNLAGGRVLNASRRHWGRHTLRVVSCARCEECSTPLGVTGVGTPTPSKHFSARRSAQRLSASLGSAP
ncbi:MAG: hypothetical protein JWO38_1997, partial [Gemmataceae bacterium]|nr:hypothetical protein [Gemmataceae bacterium]